MKYEAMSEAAKRRAVEIKKKHGDDYHERIGRKGGKTRTENTKNKGFASNPDLASEAGRRGGEASAERYGKNWLNERSLAARKKK